MTLVATKRGKTVSLITGLLMLAGLGGAAENAEASAGGGITGGGESSVAVPQPERVETRPVSRPVDEATARSMGSKTVNSTAYCLTGTMANGQRASWGSVAANGVPMGTRYAINSGPMAGLVVTVRDRIGHGSSLDIAMPGNCGAARSYGRRQISFSRLP